MSRMTPDSSAGMQVTRSSNNVYTALLLVSLVALVGLAIYMGMVLDTRFGFMFPIGEQYDANAEQIKQYDKNVDNVAGQVEEAMTTFKLDADLSGGTTEQPSGDNMLEPIDESGTQ